MSTTAPPSTEQIEKSLEAYHLFVEAFLGQIPFTCIETFEGNIHVDQLDPAFPYMRFSIENSDLKSRELEWFLKFIDVWNHKQIIEWVFRPQPPNPPATMVGGNTHYILAPKDANKVRNPWFVVNARHAAAQLGAFFNAWKYGLLHQTAKLPTT